MQGSSPGARRLLNNIEALEGEDAALADLLMDANVEGRDRSGRKLLGGAPPVSYQITLFSRDGDFGDAVSTDGVRRTKTMFEIACARREN